MDIRECLETIKSAKLIWTLNLVFNDRNYLVKANSPGLVETLKDYFKEWVADPIPDVPVYTVLAMDSKVPEFKVEFTDYIEQGKTRIKESYFDDGEYRVVRKVKTGVHFVVSPTKKIALGPLEKNSNQLINFINVIFMENELQGNTYLFHAAAVSKEGAGIVIAAQSGKGKSTTALHLMKADLTFTSNDRVILKKKKGSFTMYGVPKHPRVNPGTLLNNPVLKHLLKDPERFENMPKEELWNWEEKYDAVIHDIYGPDKFALKASAKAFLIIDWGDSDDGLSLEELDLKTYPEILPAIMKAPSLMAPDQHEQKKDLSGDDYTKFLEGLPVYRLVGKVDPEKAIELVTAKFF